jgi:ArsR family transcriptional regulator
VPTLENDSRQELTPEQYIRENFEPSDRIAVLVLNRESGRRVQRVVTAHDLASESWQRWLRAENAQGADIYISQNTLRENTRNRKKEDIAAIRHVYLDLDQNGAESLAAIESSPQVPPPSYVITSSPGKYQVIWKVKEMTQEQAESLQRRMVEAFGADPAATDSSRVLRLPGFINKKYEQPFQVVAEARSRETYRFQDFKLAQGFGEHRALAPAGPARAICDCGRPGYFQYMPFLHTFLRAFRKLRVRYKGRGSFSNLVVTIGPNRHVAQWSCNDPLFRYNRNMNRRPDPQRIARYADQFAALGTEPRLRILRLLLAAHPKGLPAGDIHEELEIPASTLSHHLEKLKNEDLVRVRREGTYLWYTANTEALAEILNFLYAECCTRNKVLEPPEIAAICRAPLPAQRRKRA